jgi:hypothetical protein
MYKYKYNKYLIKNKIYYQNGGYNEILITPSSLTEYYKYIISIRPLDKSLPGTLLFDTDINTNIIQTMYNIHDVDLIHLTYLFPLLTFLCHINKLERALLIGLGGGHLPMLLKKNFPSIYIKIIELDGSMCKAAEHLGFKQDDNMIVVVDDGNEYCKTADKTNKYDALIIDLDGIDAFENFEFKNFHDLIHYDGILAINCCNSENKKDDFIIDNLKLYFKSIKIYKLQYNNIYLCKINKYENFNNDITKDNLGLLKIYQYKDELLNNIKIINNIIY